MDHYVPGVCADLRFTPDEELALQGAKRLHAILVDGVIAELQRLGEAGRLDDLEVVADLLGFRHYTPARFADTMRWVDLAIVGWPGEPDDGGVAELRRIVEDLGKRLVVTFGSRGVLIVDARAGWDRFVAVESVPVTGRPWAAATPSSPTCSPSGGRPAILPEPSSEARWAERCRRPGSGPCPTTPTDRC